MQPSYNPLARMIIREYGLGHRATYCAGGCAGATCCRLCASASSHENGAGGGGRARRASAPLPSAASADLRRRRSSQPHTALSRILYAENRE
jgi:hypothetical protein